MVKTQKGFTLIELMIVIAIIGILAAVAVPQYGQYTKRAKFSEVITATAAAKTAVTICYQENNTVTGCDGGASGTDIPDNIVVADNYGSVATMTTLNGIISAVGNNEVDSKTYTLTPVGRGTSVAPTAGIALDWAISGTCVTANLCKQ